MSENENRDKKKVKKIVVGDSISLSTSVTVIRIRGEANKELDNLPKEMRQEVLNEAVEVSKSTIHPYDVTLEDVKEAKKRKGVSS